MFKHFADEGSSTGSGVENIDIAVDQVAPKMLFAQPVGAFDHEAHDLIRCVNHAKTICRLDVIDFVEIFVDDLEERLFFVMASNQRGG